MKREIIIKDTHRGLRYEDGVLTEVLGRPAGLITGADGALYVSDDNKGFIYRVTYEGK